MMKKYLIIFLSLLCLSACNYHLRGFSPLPKNVQTLSFANEDYVNPLFFKLRRELINNRIEVNEISQAKFHLLEINTQERPIAYGTDGQVHRIRITLNVSFKLVTPNETLIPDSTIRIMRNHSTNPGDLLSSNAEKEVIIDEMYSDAAYQIVNRLISVANRSS